MWIYSVTLQGRFRLGIVVILTDKVRVRSMQDLPLLRSMSSVHYFVSMSIPSFLDPRGVNATLRLQTEQTPHYVSRILQE